MEKKGRPLNKTAKFIFLLLILAGCWMLGKFANIDMASYQGVLNQYPIYISAPIFIFLYVALTFLIIFGPKDVLRIMAAVLFGGWVSSFIVTVGEILNAFILFSLSRKLGRDFVRERFGLKDEHIDNVKKDSGFLGIVAIRINPLISFRLMDLGFGLSSVSLKKYMTIVILASYPRVLWLQLILEGIGTNILKDPQAVINYLLNNFHLVVYSAFYFLAVIVITVAALIARAVRKRRQKKENKNA